MRLSALFLTILLALAGCNQNTGPVPVGATPGRVSAGTTFSIAQAAALLSLERANAGVAPVVQNAALQAAAQAHANDLYDSNTFSHTGSRGSTMSSRIQSAGYTACFAAENIAQGQPDVRSVIASWRTSSGHYQNMVNAQVTQFGFARAGTIWVLVLARPC
ncbi:CAP domain-containing protein [Rhodobacterales bacterium HKCCE2091]|nr:CAP domain-containing protein [Rhodobacterales bacterium HKCCE2091]